MKKIHECIGKQSNGMQFFSTNLIFLCFFFHPNDICNVINEWMNLARLMSWRGDELHSENQFISFGCSGSGTNHRLDPASFMPMQEQISYWYFQAVIYPKVIVAVRPMVGFHQIHCCFSPFWQNLLFSPAGRPHVVPSPDLCWTLDTLLPLCTPSQHLVGFRSIKKSWTNVKILKFFPKRIAMLPCCVSWSSSLQTKTATHLPDEEDTKSSCIFKRNANHSFLNTSFCNHIQNMAWIPLRDQGDEVITFLWSLTEFEHLIPRGFFDDCIQSHSPKIFLKQFL